MVSAALVTGNAVMFKPSEQAPAVAAQMVDAFHRAGVPPAILAFLPGDGEQVGAALVEHPSIAFVAFTGSKAVGLQIIERAAIRQPGKRHVTRVIAEMGGKNALIVDSDADPDVAIPAVLTSAFSYSGQKCSALSRLILLEEIADQFTNRLVDAARSLRIGHPRDMSVTVGPLIDEEAQTRVRRYTDIARRDGRVVLQRDDVPAGGYFAGPVIVDHLDPSSPVLHDEIFGPVLAITRAATIDDAIARANDTDYALTGGIVSRTPAHIRRAATELRAGNVYINRAITGAVVGRQPFGGYGLSGVGSKAGGPDYLLQFLEPRVITENTIRQGFAPDEHEES
jgi:RHH-type proline utilization regulon transcriptional repressor/proline dehydrogenase/delta 1-pyrroline-5-carboxylate dehydrogenase